MTLRPSSPLLPSFLFVVLVAASLAALPAQGQTFPYNFSVKAPDGLQQIPVLVQQAIPITVVDLSQDSTTIVPGAPPTGVAVLQHKIDFTVAAGFNDTAGWMVVPPAGFNMYAGQTQSSNLFISVMPNAQNPYYRAVLNVTLTGANGITTSQQVVMTFFTKGIAGFGVPAGKLIQNLGARESAEATIRVANYGSLPRAFDFTVVQSDCDLEVGAPSTQVLRGHERREVPFTVRGPESRFDPLGAPYCFVKIQVDAQDNPTQLRTQTVTVQLRPEVVLDPYLVFLVALSALLLLLILLFLKRRKERLEEEILGKPQKPWLIPVEQVYLRHLKAKDQRAWYVVRHYLMEDEYRSSLLWYKAYKSATKGDRAKERLVLVQEKKYARWRRGWERDIERPVTKADRFAAKLQRKLDRKARKAHRKATAKWRKQVRKIEAKQEKAVEKEDALHAKLLARARKKGLPEPERRALPEPALPAEPLLQARPLSEHRWAKKEARFRRRRLKEQGDLEVKFERADARKQAKLHRKVQKLSRDLHDAEFVAQHTTHE